MTRRLFRCAPLVFVIGFFLTACGGGGGSVPGLSPLPVRSSAAPVTPQAATTVQFSITFPAQSASTASIRRRLGRGRAYVSPAIVSLGIAIDGGTPTYVNAPTTSPNTPTTITETVPAPPGNDTFFITEYDQINGGGDLLGKVTQTSNVIVATQNTINITVNGELASILIEPGTTPFVEGSLAAGYTLVGDAPQTFMAVPQDAKGYTIVSPGLVPSIAVSSATQAAVAVAQPQTGGNTFTLAAPAPTGFVTITASGPQLDATGTAESGATISTTFKVDALAAFYIADYFVQQVKVFDENGVPLALPTGAFGTVLNPMGLAEVPPSATNATGSILVSETSNFVSSLFPTIVSYDEAGNPQNLPTAAFPGTSQPLFLTYGANQLYVANYNAASVTIYNSTGTQTTTAAGSFPGLLNPVEALYDPDDGDIYVTDFGADTIKQFSATGTLIATATTGSHPQGIAYDSVAKNIYVAYGGTDGNVLNADGGSPQAPVDAGIDEFTPALVSVANGAGDFTNTSANTFFTGIAFDPYTKQFYVGDSGMSKIDAFTEAGAAVTLPTGAFDTIDATGDVPSSPQQILFVP